MIVFTLLAVVSATVRVPIGGQSYTLGAGVFGFLLVAFAAKALRLFPKTEWLLAWCVSAAAATLITVAIPQQWSLLPWTVATGVIAHLLGDLVTEGGIPPLYPWLPKPPQAVTHTPVLKRVWLSNGWVAVPILGTTGSVRERWIATPIATVYVTAGLYTYMFPWVAPSLLS